MQALIKLGKMKNNDFEYAAESICLLKGMVACSFVVIIDH
jgi:hypothetical protein